MGEMGARPSPSLTLSQRRPACRCPLPHDPVTGLCQRTDPEKAPERQAQATEAARARAGDLTMNTVEEKELDRALAGADLKTLDGLAEVRRRLLRRSTRFRVKVLGVVLQNIGGLEANLREQGRGKPTLTPQIQVVEVTRFGPPPGNGAGSEDRES